jgi:magnesium transporter
MPELGWRYGYFAVWMVMIAIGVGMIWFFRRREYI